MPGSGRQNFLQELKRRKVYRVAAACAAIAFVVIQVADLVRPAQDARIPAMTACCDRSTGNGGLFDEWFTDQGKLNFADKTNRKRAQIA